MNFIVFEGALGTGKTNGAVIYANYIKALSPETTLYSNFGMKGAKDFTSLYDLYEIANNFSSIVVLDEAHIDLDSRSFNSNHVKFISQTSFYLRKLRTTFIMTSPLFENLDSRIRGITNMLVRVTKDKNYFYYDSYDVQAMKYLKSKRILKKNAFKMDLYDTNSIVSPVEVPKDKVAFEAFLVNLKKYTENYYINQTDEETTPQRALAAGV